MKKRSKGFKRRISIILVSILAVSFFVSRINLLKISGLTISIKENIANIPNSAILIIAGAWVFFIALFIIAFAKDKLTSKKEVRMLNVQSRYNKFKTDLDVLYEVLKEHKKIKIKILARAFGVSGEKAMEWSKILESGHLATIEYPGLMGDPELRLIEKIIEKGDKNNEKKRSENKKEK